MGNIYIKFEKRVDKYRVYWYTLNCYEYYDYEGDLSRVLLPCREQPWPAERGCMKGGISKF